MILTTLPTIQQREILFIVEYTKNGCYLQFIRLLTWPIDVTCEFTKWKKKHTKQQKNEKKKRMEHLFLLFFVDER